MNHAKNIKAGLGITVGLIMLIFLVGPAGANSPFKKIINKTNPDLKEVKQLLRGKYIQDEIIVKFKGDTRPFRLIKIPKGKIGAKISEYLKRKDVVYAEPNYLAYAFMMPNDPYYAYQWHLDNPVYKGINMEAAWNISTGPGVTVAVIDTGIAYENYGWRYKQATDLAQTCFVAGYDFVNNDSHPNDDNGHGTHLAGTIAQSTNNNLGVAGIAFHSCLMPIKALDQNGVGTYADIIDSIYFATGHGAQIINLSLGGSEPSATLEEALSYAYNNGVTVVAAMGNDSSNIAAYPAAYDDYVIAVGATRYDETLAYYSNYGSSVDLVAPGGDLNVDQNKDGYGDGVLQQTFQQNGWRTEWGYYFMQGTSMATPHVVGTAALVLSLGKASTPDEVRTALEETAEDLGSPGRDNTYGHGLIDAYAALQWTAGPTIACTNDVDCNDNNECTLNICKNPGTAESYCVNTTVADGTLCDDNQFCTINDICTAGSCSGTAADCSDEVACTVDSCDEINDVCVNTPDNSFCDDALFCNGIEICHDSQGCQAGMPIDCDDNNECTLGDCNEDSDKCEYINVANNTECSGGICCSGICGSPTCSLDTDCNDSNACTIDSCSNAGICASACSYEEITACINNDNCCPAGCDYTTDTDCSAEPTMHVGDITFTSDVRSWGRWGSWCRVTATIPILDTTNSPVAEAKVYGNWSDAYNRNVSGTTSSNGQTTFKTNWVRGCGTFTFTVNNVTKTDWIYNPAANTETSDSITPL